MRNYASFNLSDNIDIALDQAHKIILRKDADFPIEVVMRANVTVDNVPKVYTARTLFIHKIDNYNKSLLKDDFDENMIADITYDKDTGKSTEINFVRFTLETCSHIKDKRNCPVCNRTVCRNSFAKHFLDCSKGRGCSICQLIVPDGDLASHRDTCGNRTYDCRVCNRTFTTGSGRAAHEKKCRVSSDSSSSTSDSNQKKLKESVSSKYSEISAIEGRFRIITLPVGSGTDHEGVFSDLREQICLVLQDVMGTGVKSYIVAEVKMRKLLEESTTSETFFQSTAAIVIHSSNIAEIVERQIAGKLVYHFYFKFSVIGVNLV